MQELNACPVCDNKQTTNFLSCVDYTVSQQTFQIVSCSVCTFKYTNPRPGSNEIGKFYQSEDYISHSNTKRGLMNKLYQVVRNYTISKKVSIIKQYVSRGTILDIGCGTGEFLNFSHNNGFQTTGVEPGNDARKYAIENYSLSVYNEDYIKTIPDSSFDVITMWHVLEHVHDLNDRVGELKRIIKDNGIVLIAVPNHTSLDASIYKEYWAAYDLPRHLYHFSPDTIVRLFKKHGFKSEKILPMKFDSFYVSMLSEKYKTGSVKYLSAFMNGLKSNIVASKKANNTYSSQIYLFKK
jgi:2-polyprenyl-3-methyl-5-hydroxy-6-metoxy-1,4-benzoquinol methylase